MTSALLYKYFSTTQVLACNGWQLLDGYLVLFLLTLSVLGVISAYVCLVYLFGLVSLIVVLVCIFQKWTRSNDDFFFKAFVLLKVLLTLLEIAGAVGCLLILILANSRSRATMFYAAMLVVFALHLILTALLLPTIRSAYKCSLELQHNGAEDQQPLSSLLSSKMYDHSGQGRQDLLVESSARTEFLTNPPDHSIREIEVSLDQLGSERDTVASESIRKIEDNLDRLKKA